MRSLMALQATMDSSFILTSTADLLILKLLSTTAWPWLSVRIILITKAKFTYFLIAGNEEKKYQVYLSIYYNLKTSRGKKQYHFLKSLCILSRFNHMSHMNRWSQNVYEKVKRLC